MFQGGPQPFSISYYFPTAAVTNYHKLGSFKGFAGERASVVKKKKKKSACQTGDPGSIPGLGKSPGEGNGNPLQYSCLENSMDRGAWWATVHGVAKTRTLLKRLSTHAPRRHSCCSLEEPVFHFKNMLNVCPLGMAIQKQESG